MHEIVKEMQEKLSELSDVLAAISPASDIGTHPFTCHSDILADIVSCIESKIIQAREKKNSYARRICEIREEIASYCSHLEVSIPVIQEMENMNLYIENASNELEKIKYDRNKLDTQIKMTIKEILKINQELGKDTFDISSTENENYHNCAKDQQISQYEISVASLKAFQFKLTKLKDEMVSKEAKRAELYEQITKTAGILGVPIEFTFNERIRELEETEKRYSEILSEKILQHQQLLTEIRRKESYIGVPERKLANEYSASHTDFLHKYYAELCAQYRDEFGKIFELTKSELLQICQIFDLETKLYEMRTDDKNDEKGHIASINEALLEEMKNKICELLPKKTLFCEIKDLIKNRKELIDKMTDFEKIASDPRRLFKSSFQLNSEEKFRNTAYPTLLKFEERIFELIDDYEGKFGGFYLNSSSYREILKREIENRIVNRTVFISRTDSPFRKKK
ncbi:hypothetical protein ENBRE01_0666 [Enteropsectra breve]|nr:hypothetical protein ENBRE01_0666 [Enteropsectra breve]